LIQFDNNKKNEEDRKKESQMKRENNNRKKVFGKYLLFIFFAKLFLSILLSEAFLEGFSAFSSRLLEKIDIAS
jgi:hypothetical protein